MQPQLSTFLVLAVLLVSVSANPVHLEERQTCVKRLLQCGGKTYKGATCCEAGYDCVFQSDYYSQCKPAATTTVKTTTVRSASPIKTTTTTTTTRTSPTSVPNGKDFRKPFPGSNSTYYWRNEGECKKPFVRREWRRMTKTNQKAFLDAVNCMNKKTAISSAKAPGAKTRYDDFCGSHIRQADETHNVGHFLPWHRLYLAFFEEYLAAECGYTAGIPYWDWSLDADPATFTQSPIFASDAFGGNGPKVEGDGSDVGGFNIPGRTGGGCVQDGAFKDMIVNMGPQKDVTGHPRCLARDFVPSLATNFEPAKVEAIMSQTTFENFDLAIEPFPRFTAGGVDWINIGLHGAGHFSIGGAYGTMGNMYSSCGDPTFILHHGNMDRLWWVWQQRNPATRLTDMGGKTKTGQTVTLDFPLHLDELTAPWTLTVREMMNIKGGPLCYDFE